MIYKLHILPLLLLLVFTASALSSTAGLGPNSASVDIGIFNTSCGDYVVKAKPLSGFTGTSVTNIQFAIKWPSNTVNLTTLSSEFDLVQQGPVHQSGGFNYAVFISAATVPVEWTAGNEYVLMTFSHDHSFSGNANMVIADDSWTQTNNAVYYFEMLGVAETGVIYHQAGNSWMGPCGTIDAGLYLTSCGNFEVRLKPSVDYAGIPLTNIQFTLTWPANSVTLSDITSVYDLQQQGPVTVANNLNHAVFVSAATTLINWTAGTEYTVLSFSHDHSGTGNGDFAIDASSWAVSNNGVFYAELLGNDFTGSIYHSAANAYLGNCGTIGAGLFVTSCGNFEVRLKPTVDYTDISLTNIQFTLTWPANSVNLTAITSAYDLQLQGPVTVANNLNHAVFVSATSTVVNWTAGTEYTVLSFSHDHSGTGNGDFTIDATAWAVANNGVFYAEIIGNDFTGSIYHPSVNTYLGNCGTIGAGLYLTSCGNFEVRLKPTVDYTDISLTNIQFTLTWPANSVNLTTVTSAFDMQQQGTVTVFDNLNHAVFVSTSPTTVNWTAGTEYTVLSFSHDRIGTGNGDFTIDATAWAAANNGVFYAEITGNDFTGSIYHAATNAFLGHCGIVEATVILQGPYNTVTGKMNTTINAAGNLPLAQPYNTLPWNYTGTEHVISFSDSIVDWVLVELRDATDKITVIERKAGLLSRSGIIRNTDNSSGLYFTAAENLSNYYIVIWHRNHMPVMSGLPVALPNAGSPYDFTQIVTTQPYKHLNPSPAELEVGVVGSGRYAMIAGDVNANKQLKYNGSSNDRGLILNRILSVSGSSNLNIIITGYYNEDITMDNQVKYNGSSNDRAVLFSNLGKLTGSSAVNVVYNSVLP